MLRSSIAVVRTVLAALACLTAGALASAAEHTATGRPPEPRVGVYDSRVVAYAHFWSEPARQQRDALVQRAKAARDAHDTPALKDLERQIAAGQKRIHLQTFSTAPAEEAMLALQDKLPALQRELGVGRFVAMWDTGALKGIPESNRIDVTDRLARELLEPTDKQRKTMESIKAAKPLPLSQAKLLDAAGKL
jgi:hypothetical protein